MHYELEITLCHFFCLFVFLFHLRKDVILIMLTRLCVFMLSHRSLLKYLSSFKSKYSKSVEVSTWLLKKCFKSDGRMLYGSVLFAELKVWPFFFLFLLYKLGAVRIYFKSLVFGNYLFKHWLYLGTSVSLLSFD